MLLQQYDQCARVLSSLLVESENFRTSEALADCNHAYLMFFKLEPKVDGGHH